MDFNDYDENDNSGNSSTPSSGGPDERRSSNKPFMIGIAFLGGIVILAMLAMIAFVLLNKPATSSDLEQQAAEIKAQNTAISMVATQTAEFLIIEETQKAAPTFTIIPPTATSVIAVATATPTTDLNRLLSLLVMILLHELRRLLHFKLRQLRLPSVRMFLAQLRWFRQHQQLYLQQVL